MKKKEKILLGAVFLIIILLSLCSNKKILEGMDDGDQEQGSDNTPSGDDNTPSGDDNKICNKSVDGQDYVGKFHDKDDHYCVYKLT